MSKLMTIRTNHPLVESFPFDKEFKRYFICKFKYLVKHNGPVFASKIFSEIKEVTMDFISRPERAKLINEYADKLPFRKNKYSYRLLEEAMRQPHHVVQFLKLYTLFPEPVVTMEESADSIHQFLIKKKGN